MTPPIGHPSGRSAGQVPAAAEGQGLRELRFVVVGRPAPQGSKQWLPGGRLKESSNYLPQWRETTGWAAWEHLRDLGHRQQSWKPIDAPLTLTITFTLHRPARPKHSRPVTTPDLDKLLRAVGDALTNSRVWRDDSIVVTAVVHKVYETAGRSPILPDTLDEPGAVVRIRRVDGQDVLPPAPAATRPAGPPALFGTPTTGALL